MLKRLFSIFMIGLAGYYLFENRYRVMNGLLGNRFLRRIAVGSLMSLPGVRNKMLQSVFAGPGDFR
ncbi:hypothetical protein [Bacillus sp. REN3]|uniref:hypothetical protein n=1 Tax=Bacillus sp. REN3 TaxID=2802440 RepID=UPI001AEE2331|nr:hypothetical protein [Bacillus sp. REN3]